MLNYKRDRFLLLFGALEVVVVLVFSFWSPLGDFRATPKFWRDEAVPFEIARTYAELGTLDVVVAPNTPFTILYMTHATGFPVTVPLAAVFTLFGVGVAQSRIYMVLWIMATMATAFVVFRHFVGSRYAAYGVLLISTFASLYANGRTSTGEIPGFFFLLLFLYLFYGAIKREAWSGLFLALAVVSKPSIYLLLLPAVVAEVIASDRRLFFSRLWRVAVGALPVMLFWVYLILPAPFHITSWQEMAIFYAHAINAPSLASGLPGSLLFLLGQETLWYFSVLVLVLFFAADDDARVGRLLRFTAFFGVLSFLYFMRSPGWLRYLLPFQLLVLLLFPRALDLLFADTKLSSFFSKSIFILFLLHVGTFFFFSNIQSSLKAIQVSEVILPLLAQNERSTIGIIFETPVAALIPPDRKYQIATIGGKNTVMGAHPLALPPEKLPDFIYGMPREYQYVIDRYYWPHSALEYLYQKTTYDAQE